MGGGGVALMGGLGVKDRRRPLSATFWCALCAVSRGSERELDLGRGTRGGEGARVGRKPEVGEDPSNDGRILDQCNETTPSATVRTAQDVKAEAPLHQLGPGATSSRSGVGAERGGLFARCAVFLAVRHDVVAPGGGGRQHAVVGQKLLSGPGHERGKAFDKARLHQRGRDRRSSTEASTD